MTKNATCSECQRVESNPIHDEKNWKNGGDGHPFSSDAPEPEPRRAVERPDPLKTVRKMTAAEREAAPPKIGELLCRVCGKPPISHRGRIGHAFSHPDWKSRSKKTAPAAAPVAAKRGSSMRSKPRRSQRSGEARCGRSRAGRSEEGKLRGDRALLSRLPSAASSVSRRRSTP